MSDTWCKNCGLEIRKSSSYEEFMWVSVGGTNLRGDPIRIGYRELWSGACPGSVKRIAESIYWDDVTNKRHVPTDKSNKADLTSLMALAAMNE